MTSVETSSQTTHHALLTTPLTRWHQEHGGSMAEFAGYQMPVHYGSIVAEHNATRRSAGLFDVSHMARLRFEGPRSHFLLERILTRRVGDMRLGQVRYSLICNEEGGILDDVLVSYLESPGGRQFYLLVVNAGNHHKILKWIQPHLADYVDVIFSDVTQQTAMISVQGPQACFIIQRLFPEQPDLTSRLKYYRCLITRQMLKPVIVSRTGYTGEDGFELIVRSEDAVRIWENLLLAGRESGIQPAGLGARDTLRLEAGMPLYGHELTEETNPFTAGLGFAVTLKGRNFIGSSALSNLSLQPSNPNRVGLKLTGRRVAREGSMVLDSDSRTIGQVTSGTFSPSLQCPIAMAYLARESAHPGTAVSVDVRGSKIDACVVELPFYRKSTL